MYMAENACWKSSGAIQLSNNVVWIELVTTQVMQNLLCVPVVLH